VDTVDSDGTIVGVVDRVTIDIGLVNVADQMVMDRVSTELEGLTSLSDLSVGDS
jgi:hypothetical protein